MTTENVCKHQVVKSVCDECNREYFQATLADAAVTLALIEINGNNSLKTNAWLEAALSVLACAKKLGIKRSQRLPKIIALFNANESPDNKVLAAKISALMDEEIDNIARFHRPELHSGGWYECGCGYKETERSILVWWSDHIRSLDNVFEKNGK